MIDYKIVIEDISKLKPHPKNPNQHTKEQVERLAKLIKQLGFRVPIIVSKQSSFIVSGHCRLEAAQLLGLKSVPVFYQNFDSEEAEYQFLVSDNAIHDWSELDFSKIHEELAQLGDFNFDLELLGIKNFRLDVFPEEKNETQQKFLLEIEFSSDEERNKIYNELIERGLSVKKI